MRQLARASNVRENTTRRFSPPQFISEFLKRMHSQENVKKGVPDLVIWNEKTKRMRFVEVKCPHWDKPSQEQTEFFRLVATFGFEAKVVEWEFKN